jgi:FkbM family methyltransferase
MRSVDNNQLMIAMKGASDEVKARFFDNMSERARGMFKDEMDAKGLMRLSDVEEAQKQIMRSARKLSDAFFTAESCTGDDFLFRNPASRPDGIIIDVEGSEPDVIRGLYSTLKLHRPWVVFEQLFFNPACLDLLMPPGYQRFTIHDSSGELSVAGDSRQGHNGVYLPI